MICADHNYSFDNRWAFTGDLVDYGTVEHFDGSQMRRKHSSLKRIKIHGRLPCRPMAALLELLCTNSRLEHLEIDTLEIHCDLPNEYHFNFLKRFSVDEIKIVDKFGLEVKGKSRTIRLIDNPPGDALNRLEHLYLGKCLFGVSISHVSLFTLLSSCLSLHASLFYEEPLMKNSHISLDHPANPNSLPGKSRFQLDRSPGSKHLPRRHPYDWVRQSGRHTTRTDHSVHRRDAL